MVSISRSISEYNKNLLTEYGTFFVRSKNRNIYTNAVDRSREPWTAITLAIHNHQTFRLIKYLTEK